VYLYEDEFRIFSPYAGKKGIASVSFSDISEFDASDFAPVPKGSYKRSFGVPHLPYTNPAVLFLTKHGIVLVKPF
jgi:hypothetical protein